MEWVKFTERECDLFTAYCIMQGYLRYYKKIIGRNFTNFLLMHENGIVYSWRLKSEYDSFLKVLKRKKLSSLEKNLGKLAVQNTKLNEFLKYSRFDNFSEQELLEIFISFTDIYQNYFPLFTLPKYFGMVINERSLPRRIKNKLKRGRGIADYENIQKDFLPKVFKEVGKRKRINSNLLFFALPEEIIDLLRCGKKFNSRILRKRKKLSAFLTINGGKTQTYTGKKAQQIVNANIKQRYFKTDLIKGSIAYKGVVKGRVQIVIRKADLKRIMNKIVVTPMTSIKFVPYLKNILGIVTDEGGLACHAAIISRELKTPCIIGTKIATKVLRNDDLVELDADNGVVNIIKRAH